MKKFSNSFIFSRSVSMFLPARGDILAPSAAAPPSVGALAKQHLHRS